MAEQGQPDVQSLVECQINSWLPHFKAFAYKTELIVLAQSWKNFLTADRVFVDDQSHAVSLQEIFLALLRSRSNCEA